MEIFSVKNLSYAYPQSKKMALDDIHLSIHPGEFVLLIGPSGCGKSTLVRVLSGLIPDFYGGTIGGEVLIKSEPILTVNRKELRRQVGMVFQDPERQIVMNEVEQELVFGLENLGEPTHLMQRRVIEVLSYLNLIALRHDQIQQLSSGQKQKVAIGSILAMMPEIIILDEPSSQLDPASTQEIFSILKRLNQEHGTTIILIEQRLDHCFALVDRVILMNKGRIVSSDAPKVIVSLCQKNNMQDFIPSIPRLFLNQKEDVALLTVKEAKNFLKGREFAPQVKEDSGDLSKLSPILDIKNLSFTYESRNWEKVLNDVNLTIHKGQFVVLMGENGAGKSTLLKTICGSLKPQKGFVKVAGHDIRQIPMDQRARYIGYLSQNPNDYLFNDTVADELKYTARNLKIDDATGFDELLNNLDLIEHRNCYPRDLSTGQKQRVALASVLVGSPPLILLDEPTRGLDTRLKNDLGMTLGRFIKEKDRTVILVTQDVEFAAEFADRVILFSKGNIIEDGSPQDVFDKNLFYCTQVNKLFNGIVDNVVNQRQAARLLRSDSHG